MNPILKYRGGKSREISKFSGYIPDDYDRFVEPFLGGGSVFFYLEPDNAVLNDANARLITFYKQLRDKYPEIRRQLDELQVKYEKNQNAFKKLKAKNPYNIVPNDNESLYYKMRDLYNKPNDEYLESVVYFFINKTAYSGMIRYNSSGKYNVPFGRYPHFNTRLLTEQHSVLLKNAKIFNLDYVNIFDQLNKNDFVFLDPPYDCIFNDYGNIDMMNGFDEGQHKRLAADFKNLPCRALMIIGKTPLTEGLYKEYIADEYYKNYTVNIKNRFNNDKMHIIVKNY
jgi:DNA adenine methylase